MKRILLAIFLVLLAVPAWADTDILYTYDSGGGKDYSSLATWEDNTDAVDFSTDKVVGVGSGTVPADGTAIDDGAGNSGTVYGVESTSGYVLIGGITGTIGTSTEFCDTATGLTCFTTSTVDAVGRIILDCYDGPHNEKGITFGGATNANSTHYRQVQSSASCSTPWNGTENGGCQFVSTDYASYMMVVNETYFTFYNVGFKWTVNRSANTPMIQLAYASKMIGCLVYDSENSNASYLLTSGINITSSGNGALIYNTIVRGCENDGIRNDATSGICGVICCTSLGNGGYGFSGAGSNDIVWSCYAANNTTADFEDDSAAWSSVSGWNASKDTTADLGTGAGDNYKNSIDLITVGSMGTNGILTGDTSMSGSAGAGENWGRNPYNDVTATSDFGDFLHNDTAGDARSLIDIQGDSRTDTADFAWHVGADQYISAGTVLPQVIINAW